MSNGPNSSFGSVNRVKQIIEHAAFDPPGQVLHQRRLGRARRTQDEQVLARDQAHAEQVDDFVLGDERALHGREHVLRQSQAQFDVVRRRAAVGSHIRHGIILHGKVLWRRSICDGGCHLRRQFWKQPYGLLHGLSHVRVAQPRCIAARDHPIDVQAQQARIVRPRTDLHGTDAGHPDRRERPLDRPTAKVRQERIATAKHFAQLGQAGQVAKREIHAVVDRRRIALRAGDRPCVCAQ